MTADPLDCESHVRELMLAAREALTWLESINLMAAARIEIRLENALVACGTTRCEHEWVDATNVVVKSGEICVRCRAIRAANSQSRPD